MNLPYLALYLIREFSQPLTRVDWRTCKLAEATLLKENNRDTHLRVLTHIGVYAVLNPVHKEEYKKVGQFVGTWTHHGRRLILKLPPEFINRFLPPEDYYLNRYWFMMPRF